MNWVASVGSRSLHHSESEAATAYVAPLGTRAVPVDYPILTPCTAAFQTRTLAPFQATEASV